MREHHTGIVVKNVEESRKLFECLGYSACSEVVVDNYQHNKILFLENCETLQKIELIEALDEQSTVKGFKQSFHHICYEVDEGENFCQIFKELGIGKIFTREITAPAIENRQVVFACLKNGLFVEFILGGRDDAENLCRDCQDH